MRLNTLAPNISFDEPTAEEGEPPGSGLAHDIRFEKRVIPSGWAPPPKNFYKCLILVKTNTRLKSSDMCAMSFSQKGISPQFIPRSSQGPPIKSPLLTALHPETHRTHSNGHPSLPPPQHAIEIPHIFPPSQHHRVHISRAKRRFGELAR